LSAKQPSFHAVVHAPDRHSRLELIQDWPVIPINHPWMPKPGPDFLLTVAQLLARPRDPDDDESELVLPRLDPSKLERDLPGGAGVALEQLYRSALYRLGWSLNITFKSKPVSARFLPGGPWDFPAYMVKPELRDPLLDPPFADPEDPVEADQFWQSVTRVLGPLKPAQVMLVGKHPGVEELARGQNFVGTASADLHKVLDDLGVPAHQRRAWYVTNVAKHNRLDPTSGTLHQAWINNCLPLLRQEILLTRPRCILALGTEAIKALLGKSYTVSNMAGRVLELRLKVPPPDARVQADFEDLAAYVDHTVLVMGTVHPAYVFRKPEAYTDLRAGVSQFINLTKGDRPPDTEADIRHNAYYVERPLRWQIDEIIEANQDRDYATLGDLPVAWDAEWDGRHWDDNGAYLRTLQFSVGSKLATTIVLRDKGGHHGLGTLAERDVARQVERLLRGEHSDPDGKQRFAPIRTRHGGHWFKADIPWIRRFLGVDFEPYYRPPAAGRERFDAVTYQKDCQKELLRVGGDRQKAQLPDPAADTYNGYMPPWQLTRYEGGWDTGYMARAVFEALDSYGLEALAMRWTHCPRWDLPLEAAKKELCKQLGIKPRDLFGYGDIADPDILPYASYDADVTHRLFERFNLARTNNAPEGGFLDCDVHEHSSREGFWRYQLAASTFMEMEVHGVQVDIDRGKELIATFQLAKERMTSALREEIGWPTFNPNSGPQVRAWMFGNEYNGTIDGQTGQPKQILPPGVVALNKKPIKTTGKPAKAWDQVRDHERRLFTPAVDKEVLGIYSWEDRRIKLLRDIRYVRQVLQTVLRPPRQGEVIGIAEDGAELRDDLDEFDGGFLSYVNTKDRKVRSRFYPVETGRASSAGPNVQNLCVDAATEFLTRRGWMPADQLLPTDQVAQYWPDTKLIDFVQPKAYIVQHHMGQMIHLRTEDQIDLLVTPNHRCLLRRRKTGKWFETPADQFAADCQHIQAGQYVGGSKRLTAAWVTWLCAVQADGSYGYADAVEFRFKKHRKFERLRSALDALGILPSEKAKDGLYSIRVSGIEYPAFVAKTKGILGPGKKFGPWLLDYDRGTLDLFSEEFIYWDGLFTRGTEFSSSDEENADWVQAIWALSGLRARKRLYRPANPKARDHHCVNIPDRKVDYSLTTNFTATEVPWDDNVYCVTVPSEFIVVRRGGKVSITGNSKQREDDYRRILGSINNKGEHEGDYLDILDGPRYDHPIRSIVTAGEWDGCPTVLLEFDIKSAEIAGLAWEANDAVMIADVARATLKKSHPDYLDMHSATAVEAFRLNCPPTPEGLKSIGRKGARVAAKNVRFGVPYGRSAEALARQCHEMGARDVTVQDCQRLIDNYHERYQATSRFLTDCELRPSTLGWMIGAFGRERRFQQVDDRSVMAEQGRQAKNFPIQNLVADAIMLCMYNLAEIRRREPEFAKMFRVVLQIHDALVLEVKVPYIKTVKEDVIPACMCGPDLRWGLGVPVMPRTLDGIPFNDKSLREEGDPRYREQSYYFDVDTEIFTKWSEPISYEHGKSLGIAEEFLHAA
jgi:uracil-DNA glycosylase family 4